MNKFNKLALATMIAMTSLAAVGCSEDTKPAASDTADNKEDDVKNQRAALAATQIAESALTDQFASKKGLAADGSDYEYFVPKQESTEAAVEFLSKWWDKDLVKKEYEALLADSAKLEEINAAIKAKVDKDNAAAEKAEDKTEFTPITVAADSAKLGANDIASANVKFDDVKVTKDGDNYIVEAKGLKYTVSKNGNEYKVIAKEGTLTK
ncbi:MAG TPA: hypothetical protein VFV52_04040 [Bacilli bacterium]|nr:hypothetical protein [Bacilli bacterium]